jgi:hypothetical protein
MQRLGMTSCRLRMQQLAVTGLKCATAEKSSSQQRPKYRQGQAARSARSTVKMTWTGQMGVVNNCEWLRTGSSHHMGRAMGASVAAASSASACSCPMTCTRQVKTQSPSAGGKSSSQNGNLA